MEINTPPTYKVRRPKVAAHTRRQLHRKRERQARERAAERRQSPLSRRWRRHSEEMDKMLKGVAVDGDKPDGGGASSREVAGPPASVASPAAGVGNHSG